MMNPEIQEKAREPRFQVSTPQLAVTAGVLSVLTGAVFFIELSFARTPASVAVASEATQTAAAEADPFPGMMLEAKSAIAYDLADGAVLYEKNADVQLPLASLTKIALILAVADVLEPDDYIMLANDAYSVGSADTLKAGERWRVKDMIDYTLLGSSNGGAIALAAAADNALRVRYPDAQEGEAALYGMNVLAADLGLEHTYFLNTTGLDEDGTVSGSYGSARDVARIMRRALLRERFFAETTQDTLVVRDVSGNKEVVAFNTNEALPVIPGLVFGKTGFTDLAGGNLAIVFEPEPGRPVAVVVLASTQEGRFSDMEELVRRVRDL